MKPKIRKIMCPNKIHGEGQKGKILMLYSDAKNGAPKKFWLHCGNRMCKQWTEIRFTDDGKPIARQMPCDVSFDVDKIPVWVIDQ